MSSTAILDWEIEQMDVKGAYLMSRSYSKGIRSEGLQPQLVCCAPFPSIAQYFRKVYVSYLKIQMAIVVYPKVWTTIV
jgi:hypothetical protein